MHENWDTTQQRTREVFLANPKFQENADARCRAICEIQIGQTRFDLALHYFPQQEYFAYIDEQLAILAQNFNLEIGQELLDAQILRNIRAKIDLAVQTIVINTTILESGESGLPKVARPNPYQGIDAIITDPLQLLGRKAGVDVQSLQKKVEAVVWGVAGEVLQKAGFEEAAQSAKAQTHN